MTFTIRAPSLDDAEELAALHVASWRETYAELLPGDFFSPEMIAERRRLWNRVLVDPRPDMTIRVACVAGVIVGFAWAGAAMAERGDDPPRDRQLYALYVVAAHHGTGAGQTLLDETLGSAQAMLWVATENPRAIAFYARNGFRFDGAEQVDPRTPGITEARMLR